MAFFAKLEQSMETQKTLNTQNTPEKEEQRWGIMLPDFGLYYMQNYGNQNHSTDKRTNTVINGIRIENPEINPYT